MENFDTFSWIRNRHLKEASDLMASNASGEIKTIQPSPTGQAMLDVIPEDYSYKALAKDVADILLGAYGREGNKFNEFMKILHAELGIEESLNENELKDAAKEKDLELTFTKKDDGTIEVGGSGPDKDDFEHIARKLGYSIDRVDDGDRDNLYIKKK